MSNFNEINLKNKNSNSKLTKNEILAELNDLYSKPNHLIVPVPLTPGSMSPASDLNQLRESLENQNRISELEKMRYEE